MISPSRMMGMASGLLVLICLLACGNIQQAAARQKKANDLKQLGMMYHNFHDRTGKGPATTQDLIAMSQGDPQATALAAQTGPGGQYVLMWKGVLGKMTQGTSNTVLGFEASVPATGGMVLMADGSVRPMTVAEFNAAPKPGPAGGN